MDNYKLAFLYGKDDITRNIIAGQLEKYGNILEDKLHIECLLKYIKEKGFTEDIFNKLTIKHAPEVVAYLISKKGHIVFLNITKKIKTQGKNGLFIIPDDISPLLEESLFMFADSIKDFNVSILYNLRLSEGFLDGKELVPEFNENPRTMLERYFEETKKEKQY